VNLPDVTGPAAAADIETRIVGMKRSERVQNQKFLEGIEKIPKAMNRNAFLPFEKISAVLCRFPYSIFYRIVSGRVM
jgi:hypothetical protein